jgi:nitroreductase
VIEKISLISGCICIFLCWDEQRQNLVNYLKSRGIHSLVLILTERDDRLENLNLGSIEDDLTSCHILKLGKIQEELIKL